jgi:small conductance mechanosensitive channel
MNFDIQKIYENAIDFIFLYGPKIIGAIIVWIIGLWVIRIAGRGVDLIFNLSKLEVSLKTFLYSLFSMVLKVLLAISVLGMLGIEMTSFIAILGAAGLAFGMAMSGTLQNFAVESCSLFSNPSRLETLLIPKATQEW